MSDFLGKPYDREEIFNIPLIVHIPNSGITETISTTGGHLDYEPTILNLLGLRNDKAVMFGQDLVNSKTLVTFICRTMYPLAPLSTTRCWPSTPARAQGV